ncbi:major facilitator superfamily domain-containing protein 6-like [Lytechinus pictus]|uniref:major facilitator superfamily domain-containing protein 6-like n=1 Tax=Lytechinus pictus TaxID=7653 RepID=UPI0030B9B59F
MYLPEDNTLPFEAGNVAPSLHGPPPKFDADLEGDSKERKKKCATHIDIDLLKSKSFYFLFYGAYGSLYPLLAVYFKQLGLNASQSGLLIGIRPFIEFCAAPLWGGLADSWRKAKVLFLFSLFAWLLFTEAMAFIRPAGSKCIIFNQTDENGRVTIVVDQIVHDGDVHHYVYGPRDHEEDDGTVVGHQSDIDQPFHTGETSPTVDKLSGGLYKLLNKSSWTGEPIRRLPPGTSGVTFNEDVRGVFLLLLIIIVVGEFFSSPTITLADSATLGYLGSDRLEYYGQQRMFGSLGWGIFMLIEGILLDHTATHTHGCGDALAEVIEVKRNYYICFGTYAVLITCSFFVATQFKFKYYSEDDHKTEMTKLTYNKKQGQISISGENRGAGTYGSVASPEGTNPTSSNAEGGQTSNSESIETTDPLQGQEGPLGQSGPVACNRSALSSSEAQSEDPAGIRQVFRMYATIRYGSVLCVAWFAGFGMGLLFTFLYWHLQDLGGPPSLFGLASVVNHVSEILAYFFSHKIVQAIGHIPVFCLGLFCYAIRFLAISVLINPWWVLIVETLQGLTHALIWAACTSYIGLATSQRLRSSAQGILQGTHHGLGRGCGAIFGGLLVNAFGTEQTFRGFGVASLVVLVIFLAMQYPSYYNPKPDPSSSTDPTSSNRARSTSSSNRDEIQPVLTAEDVTPIPYSEKRDETVDDDRDRDLEIGGDDVGGAPSREVEQGAAGGGEF